jgi:hypothetical protein
MPDDAPPIADLSPRTWRGWWLEQSKWLRIGCWAVLVALGFHTLVAVRMAVGWIDDPDITELRMVGGEVCYPWRDRDERFEGEWLLWEGIMGRSKRNIYAIVMPKHLDIDTKKQMANRFPDVVLVGLIPWDAEEAWPSRLQNVCKHYADEATREREKKPVIIRVPEKIVNGWPPLEFFKTQLDL